METRNIKTDYEQLSVTILENYPIIYDSKQWLGHSENVTFRIATKGTEYLLRLHTPYVPFREAIWTDKKQ
ncbi:hypothetical protein PMSD_25115 [Paenibacillus macquariensis subsp. defensor]|nr:hypothetical protein PMSD_25115 [Paenibacillus macquariensis subsp. defensor]